MRQATTSLLSSGEEYRGERTQKERSPYFSLTYYSKNLEGFENFQHKQPAAKTHGLIILDKLVIVLWGTIRRRAVFNLHVSLDVTVLFLNVFQINNKQTILSLGVTNKLAVKALFLQVNYSASDL